MSRNLGRHLKQVIESTIGLSLGDSVNVAIFVLTIISLAVAFGGVWVAWATLADARKAGESQSKAMSAQITALQSASASLTTLLDQFDRQRKLGEKQTEILESVQQSTRQSLSELKAENTREKALLQRHPEAEITLQCRETNNGAVYKVAIDAVFPNLDTKGAGRPPELMLPLPAQKESTMDCYTTLSNRGSLSMENVDFSWDVTRTDRNGDQVEFIKAIKPIGVREERVNTLQLLKHGTVYPLAIRVYPEEFMFDVTLPHRESESETLFDFGYTLRGSNLRYTRDDLLVHVKWGPPTVVNR
jgi:hypothetical protein